VTPVAASGGGVDTDVLRREVPELTVVAAKPVDALLDAARGADLLVVGSRGLTGVRALGSISERVAHRAGCSVLVVRGPGIGEHVRSTD
jgi:nucleotide-binding universal stress UspA family protein